MNQAINICILAVARYEDLYLDEWIRYHTLLGFDHIYICDNNDKPMLTNYDNITIYPFNDIDFSIKGIYETLCELYNVVLKDIYNKYDYCAIIDIDEFFNFKDCSNVKEFISKYIDDNDYLQIPWEVYNDNDLIFHIDKPVQELYTKVLNKMSFNWCKNECSWGKSIFKLYESIQCDPHRPLTGNNTIIDKSIAVVKHYRTKCLEDYIKLKCLQRNAVNAKFTKGNIIQGYFQFNDVNLDKLMYALRFCKDCNFKLSISDKLWICSLFELYCPITIVIRTHNRVEQLKECIKNTINKQKYKCKVLVLNDGSLDNTSKWLSEQHFDFLSLKDNVGPGEILARGKWLITTPYYIMLDDDDNWKYDNVVEYFYNILIENPYLDICCCKNWHVANLVRTQLLLECPNISLYTKDDHYFCWIENHAKNIIKVNFDFYNYRSTLEEINHVNNVKSLTTSFSYSFYKEQNFKDIINYYKNYYHYFNLKERKAFDQMINYINNLN